VKRVLTILVVICSFQALFAQTAPVKPEQSNLESLKQAFLATTNDTLRLVLANDLRNNYFFKNINYDSTLFYSRQVVTLAHKLGYKIDEAYGLDVTGYVLNLQKNEHTLETFFKGIKIAEDPQIENKILPRKYLDMMVYWQPSFTSSLKERNWSPHYFRLKNLASLYQDLGHAYAIVMPDQQRLFFYMSKAIEYISLLNDTLGLSYAYGNIAEYFYSSNQIDSALYYAQKAQTLNHIANTEDDKYDNYPLLAAIYFRKGNDSLAFYLIRQAIQNEGVSVQWQKWLMYFTVAQYFFKNSILDSSLYYAIIAYKTAIKINSQDDQQKTSDLLAKLYKTKGVSDSALRYYEIASALNDTLNDANKKAQLQRQDFEQQREQEELEQEQAKDKLYLLFVGLAILLIIALFLLWNNQQRQKANKVLQQKNVEIEHGLQELKSTQSQLIQSEKMASLGELTAGIAHEIQNPLNFVNNFSEVNKELLEELEGERSKVRSERDEQLENDIIKDIKENEEKINHHGKRADSIVKGMLQHSRASSGQKELTDINKLADEYLRLSYHGMKARDKSFDGEFKTEFDESIGKINVVPQDIGRVLLNLYNNAFYAVNEKSKNSPLTLPINRDRLEGGTGKLQNEYTPLITVRTKLIPLLEGKREAAEIIVKDNGNGIPKNIVDKIYQPFFTTKPTGEGTGLGLSLAYDIIKAHGGEIKVETKDGEGSEFTVTISR
jgi:signal transduction histidine kinase